jgi:hypothetical protein
MPILKIVGLADGPSDFDDSYVVEYDPTIPYGVSPMGFTLNCHLVVTRDKSKARVYATMGEALEDWKRAYGLRPDGQPNRPLTAFNVEVLHE